MSITMQHALRPARIPFGGLHTRPAVAGQQGDPDDHGRADLERLSAMPPADSERRALRNRVIEQGLPLAERIARRFQHRGESLEDLVQVARIGLVKSVDGFDANRGTSFASYAAPTIVGELKRHFRDKGWSVRVPRRLQEARLEVNRATSTLSQELGHTPTVPELARYLDMSEADVRAGLECARAYSAISLHTPVADGSGMELADVLGDVDPQIELVEARETLRPLIARLPVRERRVLMMRFFDGMTQSQIAARVELSQMHVSRLISQTLAKLRGWMLVEI